MCYGAGSGYWRFRINGRPGAGAACLAAGGMRAGVLDGRRTAGYEKKRPLEGVQRGGG